MKAYLVDLIDPKTQVHQRIWVKARGHVSLLEMTAYVKKLKGLRIKEPQLVSFREKTLPSSIRQELIEKFFPIYTK